MSTPINQDTAVVIASKRNQDTSAVENWLQSSNLTAHRWFDLSELDELNKAVCKGQINHVIFESATLLLDALWDNRIEFGKWRHNDIHLDFMKTPHVTIDVVHHSWQQYIDKHRRRQIVAGAILSGIAVVLGFLINLSV